MTTEAKTQEAAVPAAEKCRYCYKPIETMHKHTIIYQGYDNVRRKKVVKCEVMHFCSPNCGSSYQMGCEG